MVAVNVPSSTKGSVLVACLNTGKEEGISEELLIKLADRTCETIYQEDEPRFTALDLAEALLHERSHQLDEVLWLDDDAFNTLAIQDAQKCRETWSS